MLFRKKRTWVVLVIVGLLFFANSCMKLRTSSSKVQKQFEKKGVPVQVNHYDFEGKSIRYVLTDKFSEKKLPLVVFVHGAPGSSDNFYQFMQDIALAQRATMISVDRLGYGYSDFGVSETSITKQAESLRGIIEKYRDRSVILVGHSYGGPIIANYAMQHPEEISGLLFLAPAIDPDNEKVFWISHLGRVFPTRWLTPTALRVATDEKFTHVEELKLMDSSWDNIKSKSIYIHGDKDGLVPYENMFYATRKMAHLPLDTITVKGGGHLLPWKNKQLIKKKLLELIND